MPVPCCPALNEEELILLVYNEIQGPAPGHPRIGVKGFKSAAQNTFFLKTREILGT